MRRVSRSRRGLLVGLLLLITAIAFEGMAVATAMPAAAEELGRVDLYAWAFTAFTIAQIVAIVLAGRFCDQVGPVRPLWSGLALFTGGIVVAALAPSMAVLLAGRFVQGLGGGFVSLSLMVLVGRAYDPAERGQVMTWFSAAWMLPSFVGPAAAAWITQALSWHWVFWGVLPFVALGVGFLAGPLSATPLPIEHAATSAHVPAWAGLALAAGVGLVQAAGQRPSAAAAALAAVGLLTIGAAVPRLMPTGFSPLNTGVSAVMTTRLLISGAFFGSQSFLPLMLVQVRGLTLTGAGLVVTVSSVGWMLGSWLQSRPWLRLRRDVIVALGASGVAGGVSVVAVACWLPTLWVGVVALGATIAGVGMGLQTASTSLAVMQLSPAFQLGWNTGSLQVAEAMGMALLAGLAGTLFAWWHARGMPVTAFAAPASAMAGFALVGLLAALRIGPVRNHSAATATAPGDRRERA